MQNTPSRDYTKKLEGRCFTSVLLATIDTASHMNLHVEHGRDSLCAELSPETARALRDALIEAYPLEPKGAPCARYEALKETSGWAVHRTETVLAPIRACIAEHLSEEHARVLASGMNDRVAKVDRPIDIAWLRP